MTMIFVHYWFLTLKAPITTAADDKFCNVFPNFQKIHENCLPADDSHETSWLCPHYDNGRCMKCYPCRSVRTYVRTYVLTYIRLSKQHPLSKSNTYDQNFMKLGHIVKYHNVFFKFDNGPYRTMLSVVMALCLWKFTIWNDVRTLSWKFLIRILWNLVTLFGTMMSSSSSIMVYIAPHFQ